MTSERKDNGTYRKKVSNKEFLDIFEEAETPVLTAKMISKELPISKHSVNVRLNKLHESNRVARLKAGSNAVVWWLTDKRDSHPS